MKYKIQFKPDEEILKIVRESLAPHFLKIVFMMVWFLIPFFFLFPLFHQGTVGIVFFLLLLGSASWYCMRWLAKWRNTTLVITDIRVFDIEQKGFFDTSVSEMYLKDLTDVAYRKKGFWSTLFRYGAVKLSAKNSSTKIIFSRVKHPDRLYNMLNDLRIHARDEGYVENQQAQ